VLPPDCDQHDFAAVAGLSANPHSRKRDALHCRCQKELFARGSGTGDERPPSIYIIIRTAKLNNANAEGCLRFLKVQ
jgi:hypothetical protein